MIFTHDSGRQLRRPVFWDGGTSYRCDSPQPNRRASGSGAFTPPGRTTTSSQPTAQTPVHPSKIIRIARWPVVLPAHPSGRSFCYADGSPAFWVFDTAWAMPFRATVEDVVVYAADRQAKGFNAVLLMSVQPDMNARGPVGRNVDEGFEIGFHDLPEGASPRSTSSTSSTRQDHRCLDQPWHHPGAAAGLPRIRLERARRGRPGRAPADYALLPVPGGALRCPPAIYLPCGDGAGTSHSCGRGPGDPRLGRVRSSHRHPLSAPSPQRRTSRRRLAGLPVLPDRAHG